VEVALAALVADGVVEVHPSDSMLARLAGSRNG
jgi:hypothetical protein